MTEQQITPTPTPTPAGTTPTPAPVRTASTSSRFAAYDKRFEKFVGGVHDTKNAARDAAKLKGVKSADLDVREV